MDNYLEQSMIACGAPILVVEDSQEDFKILQRTFEKVEVSNPVFHCEDGDDAIRFLYRKPPYVDAPEPILILLDLNLPGTDGYKVLTSLKSSPTLSQIPVVILTTSSERGDIQFCKNRGANSYIQKTMNLEEFTESIQKLKSDWLTPDAL
jgi:CheY-like chemotaxis protein